MKLIDAELLNRTSAQARTDDRLRKNYNFHERPDGSYLPAHRHLNPAKDEAIVVLRGSVASFIFDDRGEIAECAVIDPQQGVYGFDIPAGEWHSLLVLESGTVVYEVKPGPYVPLQESDLAPWTPRTGDAGGIDRYLKRLQDELSNRNKQSKI